MYVTREYIDEIEKLRKEFDNLRKIVKKILKVNKIELNPPYNNTIDTTATYYKILCDDICAFWWDNDCEKYVNGLNVYKYTHEKFDTDSDEIRSSGFYFTTEEHLKKNLKPFINPDCTIAKISLPDDYDLMAIKLNTDFFDRKKYKVIPYTHRANMIFVEEKYSVIDIEIIKKFELDNILDKISSHGLFRNDKSEKQIIDILDWMKDNGGVKLEKKDKFLERMEEINFNNVRTWFEKN